MMRSTFSTAMLLGAIGALGSSAFAGLGSIGRRLPAGPTRHSTKRGPGRKEKRGGYNKYQPHQGAQECARRIHQGKHLHA